MEAVFVFNTLSNKREELVPRVPGKLSIYGCGPTVYGLVHVGNARAALTFDTVHRVLKMAGFEVDFSRNITDIDDKIIKVANEAQVGWEEIAEKFTRTYRLEMEQLRILPFSAEPTATGHIDDIVLFIGQLIEKDLAYVSETPFGADVYFRVRRFKDYGKLSKKRVDELEIGVRIEAGESKDDPLDFALWKAAKSGEPSWPAPWGAGRPGWHIECSAMIQRRYPDGLDIHMGGLDLIFPHHENEIAQSESLNKSILARYWIHNGMLVLGKEKMSKSIGNIFTLERFLALYGPEVLRLMCAQHHYRAPMDFSEESILRSEHLLGRLYAAKLHAAQLLASQNVDTETSGLTVEMKKAMFDDFNLAKALGFVLKALRDANRSGEARDWALFASALPLMDAVMGLLVSDPAQALAQMRARKLQRLGVSDERAREIDALLEAREAARKQKDFALSDRLRGELEAANVAVMDGPDGPSWSLRTELGQ